MNDSGSITEFFYNIVPGSIFLILLNLLTDGLIIQILKLNKEQEALVIFFLIVCGLFIGFFFQCLTKIARSTFWNQRAITKVSLKEANKQVLGIVKDNIPVNSSAIFYYMDDSLRGEVPAFLPTHFSSRFAFWANIFWGSFFLSVISLMIPNCYLFVIFFLTCCFSAVMADEHLTNYHDTILKTFYMNKIWVKK